MSTEALPASIEAHVATLVDSTQIEATVLPSSQGRVWRIDVAGTPRFAVKCAPASALRREREGLEICAGALLRVPAIERYVEGEDGLLVCRWLRGAPALPDAATMLAAGRWLARMHAIPCADEDNLPIAEAVALRAQRWAARAASIEPRWLDTIVDMCRDLPLANRVWCHRDFVPEHWRIHPTHGLGVIDFGQTRLDAAPWDLVKLAAQWSPSQRDAFFEGYGSTVDPQVLHPLVLLHGLQTAVWGDLHEDATFSSKGRSILEAHLTRR